MKYWETKTGDLIAYNKLKDDHLQNILKFIEKRAKEGVDVYMNLGWENDNDFQTYDGYTIYGKEVEEHFDLKGLQREAKKRNI